MFSDFAPTLQYATAEATKETEMIENTVFSGAGQKTTLLKAMDALFRNFDERAMRRFYKEDYIQHNPHVPTGLASVLGLLPALKEAGFDYNTHRVIEDGDLMVTHTTYSNAQIFGAETVVAAVAPARSGSASPISTACSTSTPGP